MAGRTAMPDLGERDRRLLRVLGRDMRAARLRAGARLRCEPGCCACCHGPFPVTRLDVWRLRRGLARLAADEPDRARAVRRRAGRAARRLAQDLPGCPRTGRLERDVETLDRFFARHADLACPVLDPETGRCELYDWRPVSCRTYGPPLAFDRLHSDPCPLCFRGADAQTVERCRVRPDRRGLERSLLRALGVADGEEWETLIALGLARG